MNCAHPVRVRLGGGTRSVNLISLSFLRSTASIRWERSLDPASSSRFAAATSNSLRM